MLKPGLYLSKNNESGWGSYKITMEVKETEKSFIFCLVELKSRCGGDHIKRLFHNSKRVVIRKNRGGHGMRVWSDEDFTIYPYQAGTPYWFQRV